MPNYTIVLNEEIARIAKKEVKAACGPLAEKIKEQKKKISELTKIVRDLEKRVAEFEEVFGFEDIIDPTLVSEEEVKKARITPKYISGIREKHSLSRNLLAALLDINQNTIYLWENGRAVPRDEAKAKLIQLKKMGKKEVKQLLEEVFPG